MLGLGLLLLLAFAWIAFGGVHHGSRAVLHCGLAVLAVLASSLPPNVLRKAGVMVPLAAASALLLGAVAVGLMPVPRVLLGVVSPSVAAARPGFSWWTLSLDPERTVGELADLLLPLGFGVLVALWGAARHRRRIVEGTLAGGVAVVAVVGAAHALSGAPELFGWVPTSVGDDRLFWAPFIDPNHFGSALVLGLPLATAVAIDNSRERSARVLGVVSVVALVGLLCLVRSSGAIVAGAFAVVATGWALGAGRWVIGVVAALGAGAAGAWLWLGDPGSAVTLQARLEVWWRAGGVVLGSWLAGTGGGTFGLAVQPGHTDFNLWSHAHNDLVEWVVETGLVGVVAGVVAVLLVRPGPARNPRRALPITLAVAAIGVHAMVDFPLQIPALAMATAALFAIRRAVHEPRSTIRPMIVRSVLAVLVVLQLGAAAWELRTGEVERAIAVLDRQRYDLNAESTVSLLAPWRPELTLARGWRDLAGDDREGAVAAGLAVAATHPHDGTALRRAGRLLLAADATEDALRVLDRSRERFPGDWRTAVVRARATEPEHQWEAWSTALGAGAPPGYLEEAFESLPEGVVWLDVAEERDGRFAQALGGLLLRREQPEAALLAFELAARTDPELLPHQGHVRLLIERGRLQEAGTLAARGGSAARYRALQAEVLEASGHEREALETWTALSREAPSYSFRALRSAARVDGVEAAIALGGSLQERGGLDGRGQIGLAQLYRDDGQAAQCRRVLDAGDLRTHRILGSRAKQLYKGCDRGVQADEPESVEVPDP